MDPNKQYKIFLVTSLLSGKGGVETVIKTIHKELQRRDIKVKIIFLGKYKSQKNDLSWLKGIDFKLLLPSFPFRKFLRSYIETQKLAKLITEEKPDALIGLNNGALLRLAQARKKTYPYKIFSWVHFSLQILRRYETLNKADFHLSISSGITRELVQLLSIPKNRVFTLYNPNPCPSSSIVISRPKDGGLVLLFIGRLTEQKDPFLLLDAVSKLKGAWRLHIVGDGPLKNDIENSINQLGLEDKVFLHGWKVNVWDFVTTLGPISALILPSRNEGFPMVLLEAMAHGIYCVSSDCETGPEDIITEDNGELFEVGNAEELQKRLQKIIDSRGLQLPSHDSIRASIERFSVDSYCDNFLWSINEGNKADSV